MQLRTYDDGGHYLLYETLEELLQLPNIQVTEYGPDYYVEILPPEPYCRNIYKVDKATRKLSYIRYIDYMIDIEDKAKPIDPRTLKKVS